MKNVLIFKMWRYKLPALSALVTMAVAFLWPALFLGGITNWLRFFYYYSPQNYLLAAVTLLSGIYVGLFVYDKTLRLRSGQEVAPRCSLDSKVGGAAGSIFGIFLGACPACIPFLAVFLPLSATITLSYFSWIFSTVSIFILLFFIWRMRGFKKLSL